MNLKKYYNIEKDSTHFHLTITSEDLLFMKLDEFDRDLLDECMESNKISDILLGLETIVRRIEESNEHNKK